MIKTHPDTALFIQEKEVKRQPQFRNIHQIARFLHTRYLPINTQDMWFPLHVEEQQNNLF